MMIGMEYLTQAIGVLITLTQDASKKVLVVQLVHTSSSSSLLLLLLGLGTKQDSDGEMRIYYDDK